MSLENRPKVGVGVLVFRDGRVLLGDRINKNGRGWCPPGGHLEYGETVEQCAAREALEEAGIEIANIVRAPYTEDVFEDERKHYITLHVVADWTGGEPEVREPENFASWQWFGWKELPKPLVPFMERLLAMGFDPKR